MVKNIFAFCVLLVISLNSISQTEFGNIGARQDGMGGASLTLNDVWGVFNNPAGTAQLASINTGIYYENRFLLKETGLSAFVFSAPLGGTTINFGLSHFGFSSFQKEKFALGFSQQLFDNFFLGLQADFFTVRQSLDYGNYYGMSFELGAIYHPTKALSFGTYLFNPVNVSYFADNNYKLPFCLRLGMSYLFSKSLLLSIETGKSINGYTQALKTGIEYAVNEQFRFRAGISLIPVEYSFGLGYFTNGFSVDFAYAYHQILGSTPKLSISYAFLKKNSSSSKL